MVPIDEGMRVPDLAAALERLRGTGDAHLGAGAPAAAVTALPPGYREFVEQTGWATVGDLTIFGLGPGAPPGADLPAATSAAHEAGLPANFVPIARDGGAVFALDSTHQGPYASPVYRWAPGAAPEYEGHDFPSWLWTRLA